MSLLPQRKKSPEEIAKLRESLGIPGVPAENEEAPSTGIDTVVSTHHEAVVVHENEPAPAADIAPLPSAIPHGPKPVHSLKRSERIPALPTDEPEENPTPAPDTPAPRQVRSLRKSEQIPVLVTSPTKTSGPLPVHRHSDAELAEIRRREAIAMMHAAPNPKLAPAHPAIIAPGYLLALAGASCWYFESFPLAATAGCAATALLLAAFILIKKPISRHHAAFIAVIAMLVIVFGALHYFPHLRHAT